MKATKITYARLKSLGDYQHEKIGIELDVEDGEKAKEVLEKARLFVNTELGFKDPNQTLREKHEYILKNPDTVTASRYLEAKEWLQQNPESENYGDIPPF